MKTPTERFTNTVQDYSQYRPSYPKDVLQVLTDECGLAEDKIIADIGSGTGIFSKLLLDHGHIVYAVEPNEAMRLAAENALTHYPRYHSINGSAEHTTLPDHSTDIITAATAFHWFDAKKTKREFKRILKKSGWVMLIWNVRDIKQSKLLQDYEKLILEYGKDYRESRANEFDKTATADFFSPHEMKTCSFKNVQYFDWEGFKGRLLSTSYSLRPEDASYEAMLDELKTIFNRYQQAGKVEFLYQTKLYYGQFNW